MLPGPNFVYKCPNCGNLLTNGSILSGNTFGAKIYSDGKRIAPMLPEFPIITKCKKCDNIYWLSKLEEIGYFKWGDTENSQWHHADRAEFLGIEDLFKALNSGIAENKQEEFFIRHQIWYAYNDRVRKGENLFVDENEEIKWRENCYELIPLLDQSDLNQQIMIAELNRNLGDFENCLHVIPRLSENAKHLRLEAVNPESFHSRDEDRTEPPGVSYFRKHKLIRYIKQIDNKDLNWLKEKFIVECELKNKCVIQLN